MLPKPYWKKTIFDIVGTDDHLYSEYTLVTHHVMTQFPMKEGLKRFKDNGKKRVSTELSQLHFCDTFEPVDPKTLNHQ